MMTRTPTKPTASLAVVLLAGLVSQAATATEELVVNGAEAVALARENQAALQSDMREYVRALNRDLKARLDKQFKRVEAPRLVLALNEAGGRG